MPEILHIPPREWVTRVFETGVVLAHNGDNTLQQVLSQSLPARCAGTKGVIRLQFRIAFLPDGLGTVSTGQENYRITLNGTNVTEPSTANFGGTGTTDRMVEMQYNYVMNNSISSQILPRSNLIANQFGQLTPLNSVTGTIDFSSAVTLAFLAKTSFARNIRLDYFTVATYYAD